MKRIAAAFERRNRAGEIALIPYLTAGDPSPEMTPALVDSLVEAGADLIELGVPHSDPLADGPTNQRAAARALAHGVTLKSVLQMVRQIRSCSEVPLLLFSYYNPILQYGLKKFSEEAAAAGVDGAIVTDLPPEEADELRESFDEQGLALVPLLAPTSGEARTRKILSLARGFVYYVSRIGVTGARSNLTADLRAEVEALTRLSTTPVAVGFGISSPEHVRALSGAAHGVVVGSALVEHVASSRPAEAVQAAGAFLRHLATGRRPGPEGRR